MKAILRRRAGRPDPPARHLSSVEQRTEELMSRIRFPLAVTCYRVSVSPGVQGNEVRAAMLADLEALTQELLPTVIRLKRWVLD